MSEAKQILEAIIGDFSVKEFGLFFREKSRRFVLREENYSRYNDEDFKNGLNIGETNFADGDSLIICAFEVRRALTERAGKKAQYDKAKKILKSGDHRKHSAGIFIFYDHTGNFRFSLVYPESIGTRRQWNNFRRFTYFVSKEFTNKTFKQRIGCGDFSNLAKIKDAFSVEKVTEEFYKNIADWYFWAVDHCRFPKDAENEENGRNMAVIRLITRMIFIWFMRERGLVPKGLFEEERLLSILKNLSPNGSTYYKAILQNLFFATLSTKKEARQFGSEKRGYRGFNSDYNNQYVFRYQELFRDPGNIKKYFENVPFLNGGLFECLDDKKNGIIIDGFSRTKKNQPTVPNFLLFGSEKKVDLNKVYGTKGKSYKVSGLLDILSSFNFTIDENSADDQEVALDPELLGKVFENLLASFNPETATTARKVTGSYYTPREIVDYMVAESLKAYFKTHLGGLEKVDEKLESLFSLANQGNPFTSQESKELVKLIEGVRIVDPAVGSGAFPMGALNKLVFILNKIDPGNELWKEAQLKAADTIPDPTVRREAKVRIEEFFKEKNADYGRKLYLIQRCIYGVDIQQIAVEIAKLRFFISLLVDEKIDNTKDNWGIEPLPNLDFKIMQGNSLISEFLGVDFDNGNNSEKHQEQITFGFEHETDSITSALERKKIDFQNESDKDKKDKLKSEVENLMIEAFEGRLQRKYSELRKIEETAKAFPTLKSQAEYIEKEKAKFSKKHGFNLAEIEKQLREFTSKKKVRPFFPWKLYFAEVFEKGGFDIVIGNPPYGFRDVLTPEEKVYFRKIEKIDFRSGDSAELFSRKCFDKLVKPNGILTFIIPKKSLYGDAWEGYRKDYWLEYNLKYLVDSSKAFDKVLLEMCVFGLENNTKESSIKCGYLKRDNTVEEFATGNKSDIFLNNFTVQIYKLSIPNSLWEKIQGKKTDARCVTGKLGLAIGTDFYSSKKTDYKLLKGIDIAKWQIRTNRWLKNRSKLNWAKAEEFLKPKVITQVILAHIENPHPHIKITSCFDSEGIIITNTLMSFELDNKISPKFWLAYLNSSFVSWYAYNFMYARAIRTMHFYNFYIQQVPIPAPAIKSVGIQKPFIAIVNKILAITNNGEYTSSPTEQAKVKEYEKQIDQLVYNLYGLTPEEIEIVEENSK